MIQTLKVRLGLVFKRLFVNLNKYYMKISILDILILILYLFLFLLLICHIFNFALEWQYYITISVPYKQYTDDTAMMRCVALSLIEEKKYVAQDMARR